MLVADPRHVVTEVAEYNLRFSVRAVPLQAAKPYVYVIQRLENRKQDTFKTMDRPQKIIMFLHKSTEAMKRNKQFCGVVRMIRRH